MLKRGLIKLISLLLILCFSSVSQSQSEELKTILKDFSGVWSINEDDWELSDLALVNGNWVIKEKQFRSIKLNLTVKKPFYINMINGKEHSRFNLEVVDYNSSRVVFKQRNQKKPKANEILTIAKVTVEEGGFHINIHLRGKWLGTGFIRDYIPKIDD